MYTLIGYTKLTGVGVGPYTLADQTNASDTDFPLLNFGTADDSLGAFNPSTPNLITIPPGVSHIKIAFHCDAEQAGAGAAAGVLNIHPYRSNPNLPNNPNTLYPTLDCYYHGQGFIPVPATAGSRGTFVQGETSLIKVLNATEQWGLAAEQNTGVGLVLPMGAGASFSIEYYLEAP